MAGFPPAKVPRPPGDYRSKTQPIISRIETESQQILSPKDSSAATLRKFGKRYRASLRNHAKRAGQVSLNCPATRERREMSPPSFLLPHWAKQPPDVREASDRRRLLWPRRPFSTASNRQVHCQHSPSAALHGPDGLRGRNSRSIIKSLSPGSRGRAAICSRFLGPPSGSLKQGRNWVNRSASAA